MRKTKILIVAPRTSSQDPLEPTFVFNEAYQLSKKGVEIQVVRGSYRKDLTVQGMRIQNLSRLNLSAFSFCLKGLSSFPRSTFLHPSELYYFSNYGQKIAEVARAYESDVIHAHFGCPEGFAATLAKKSMKKPLVVTLHGSDILTDPSIDYGDRLQKAYDEKVRVVLESADKVIVASKAIYREALKTGCIPGKLLHIPNGIDLNRFRLNLDGERIKKQLGIENRQVVFTLRALVPKNGVEYLIRSAKTVVEQVHDVAFVVGGDGFLRHDLEKLTKSLDLSDNVIFTEWIPEYNLPYYYAACDVFVIPSIIEGFGLVTIEAMATGKPVIGTNVGGIPDTIEDEKNGYLVPPRDPESLAQKIILLLQDSELREKMGSNGRKMAEERFDINKRITGIMRVYSELV